MKKTIRYGNIEKVEYEFTRNEIIEAVRRKEDIKLKEGWEISEEWLLDEQDEVKGLKIIEDCAHTAGGIFKGKTLGTWGDIGCFSFEEKKCITTGDGGMMVTNDTGLFKDVKAMRWVGIDKDNWKTAQT